MKPIDFLIALGTVFMGYLFFSGTVIAGGLAALVVLLLLVNRLINRNPEYDPEATVEIPEHFEKMAEYTGSHEASDGSDGVDHA